MKRNGFTLIELLAVIVVLAIIALIATPIVLNIINNAKTSSNERSGELYVKAVENAIMKKQMSGTEIVEDGDYTVQSDGSICIVSNNACTEGTTIEVDVEGDVPTEGTITISNGVVVSYNLVVSGTSVVKVDSSDETDNDNSIKIVDGQDCTINDIGCEVQIGDEHFYVVGDDTDSSNVKLLAKYNLKVGYNAYNIDNEEDCIQAGHQWYSDNEICGVEITLSENKYNLQSEDMRGMYCNGVFDYEEGECDIEFTYNGVIGFANTNYWADENKYGTDYPAYVYDSNSILYQYIENYENKLNELYNINIIESRLLSYEEAQTLGCDGEDDQTCYTDSIINNNRQWIYNTSYWLGSAKYSSRNKIYLIAMNGYDFYGENSNLVDADDFAGIRPVIIISKSLFN